MHEKSGRPHERKESEKFHTGQVKTRCVTAQLFELELQREEGISQSFLSAE